MRVFVSAFLMMALPLLVSAQQGAVSTAKVPRPSPELVIKLASGEQVLLSKYRGKVVALEILLTTCPHCQKCSSLLQKFYQEYGAKGFQPLGAAINDGAESLVGGFVQNLGLKFPVGVTKREMAYDYLGVSVMSTAPVYMPSLVFIDRKGVIRGQFFGDNEFFREEETNLRKMIDSLVNEGATASTVKKK